MRNERIFASISDNNYFVILMQTLSSENNFLAIDTHCTLDEAAIVIVSAPYEHTVSYGGGTRLGPAGIIEASAFVEFYDDEFEKELCFEKGIATIAPIDFNEHIDKDALDDIESQVRDLLTLQKFVVTLGGEHTISTAPIKAHYDFFPSMSILHFDAHSDLRDTYHNTPFSHACFMARVAEFFPTERIVQVGIRAQCKEEAEFITQKGIKTMYASAIRRGLWGQHWQEKAVSFLSDEVYITFDVDYFDPAIMPATGTPEPDGFLYAETLDVFRQLRRAGKKIIGFDVVELAPSETAPHAALTTARLVYKLLNIAFAEPEKFVSAP